MTSWRQAWRDFEERHERKLFWPLLALSCAGLVLLMLRQEATYPGLYEAGIRRWAVHCEGQGRTYRIVSENLSDYRSGPSLIQRHLTLLTENGDEACYTVRFDPDAYEADGVWAFDIRRDSRLVPPKGGAEQVLYGDEQRLEIDRSFNVLRVKTTSAAIELGCRAGEAR